MHDFQMDIDAINRIDAVPKILNVVCRVTGMRFAAVARVTEDRWICCASNDEIAFGLAAGGELDVETTICHEIRQTRELVVIDNVAEDAIYCSHHTPQKYGFQSYISVPIFRSDGSFFGTLCAIDPKPAKINSPEVINMFKLFAELIALQLQIGDKLAVSQSDLLREQTHAELRDQFIAVLGHDLKNPLSSLAAGIALLRRNPLTEKSLGIADLMDKSIHRMSRLIDDILDFARGRLGGGIILKRESGHSIAPMLETVIAELAGTYPERQIRAELLIDKPVNVDHARISQLLSNLLANAMTHGDPAKPVLVKARTDENSFELSVENSGEPIPPATMDRMFQPFYRARKGKEGLGLGLYIASEIANAHAGVLDVSSTLEGTRFTFKMSR